MGKIFVFLIFCCSYCVFAERVVVSNVPYIHQILDMNQTEFLGHNACGPTSAVMMVKFHNLQPDPGYDNGIYRGAGWYVYNSYIGFTDKSGMIYYIKSAMDMTVDYNHVHSVKGAHGYIVNFDDVCGWCASKSALCNYLNNHGLIDSVYESMDENTYEIIKQNIRAGLPMICHFSAANLGHYLVAVGFDNNGDSIIVNDPYGNINSGQTWNGSTSGEGISYNYPQIKNGFSFDRFIEAHPIGVYMLYPGWNDYPLAPASQPFVDCYNNEERHGGGGREVFGLPWNNGAGGPWVHPWPNGEHNENTIYVQDFINYDSHLAGEDAHWWQLVLNNSLNQVFPVHGKILSYWHNNYGYLYYGEPKSYEYNMRDIADNLLVAQEFTKNGIVHYLAYNTVLNETREYAFQEMEECNSTNENDNPVYVIAGSGGEIYEPGNLSAQAVSESQISLSWDKGLNESDPDEYYLYRSLSSNLNTAVQIGSASSASYSDGSLLSETRYYYWVKAVVDGEESEYSSSVSATTLAGGGSGSCTWENPCPPGGLRADSIFENTVYFSWNSGGNSQVDVYHLYKATVNDPEQSALSGSFTGTSGSVSLLNPETRYYFWAGVDNGSYGSEYSAGISAVTLQSLVPPGGFAVIDSSFDFVDLAWNGVSAVDEYQLFRDGKKISSGQSCRFIDSTVKENKAYKYKIRSKRRDIFSAFSEELIVFIPDRFAGANIPIARSFDFLPPDSGNVFGRLAVLFSLPGSNVPTVFIKEAESGAILDSVLFSDLSGLVPEKIVLAESADGNQQLIVLTIDPATGKKRISIKGVASNISYQPPGELPGVYVSDSGFHFFLSDSVKAGYAGMFFVPDMDGNGYQEVAALREADSSNEPVIIVKDLGSGEILNVFPVFGQGIIPKAVSEISSLNGYYLPNVMSLGVNAYLEGFVEIRNLETGEIIRSY